MTSEELAVKIQSGERGLLLELWDRVERLIAWKANRVIKVLGGVGGVEFDDLYNSGFLAMVAAVDSYSPDSGAFSTWLMYHLKTAFAEAAGYRSRKQQRDPLHSAVSLSDPMGDDPNGDTLECLLPDPGAQAAMEAVEERIWRKQLHDALEETLGAIPEEQRHTLRRRYYDGMTLAAVAAEDGIRPETVRQRENKGLRKLRGKRLLMAFCDFDYYHGSGYGAFANSGMTIQERYLLKREEAEERERRYS